MASTDLTRVPLLFTFRDTVFGNGFAAEVCAKNGRALGVIEEDGCWIYGINPGGMAAHGPTPDDVHAEFRATFANVLVDFATEAADFSEFKTLVEQFFQDTNEGYVQDWNDAVEEVRRSGAEVPGLRRVASNEAERSVTITQKKNFTAADNRAKFRPQVAA